MCRCLATAVTIAILTLTANGAIARDTDQAVHISTGQFGGAGSGYTMQCSGWYPDYISESPPPLDSPSFQLSQNYYPGVPVTDANNNVTGYAEPEPPTDRPWMSIEFDGPQADPAAYAQALLQYAFDGMLSDEFDPNEAGDNQWYHAPFMHTGSRRRESLKGMTRERPLIPDEHIWVEDFLETYAIGFYDKLASYTIGRVYHSPVPQEANEAAGEFLDGAFVFKPIFAEYRSSAVNASLDPLIEAPEWTVEDIRNPGETLVTRLIQFDIAVKDPRALTTQWVFATYAYHKDLIPTEPNPWKRLVPVGLQWGADGVFSPGGTDSIEQTWINPELQDVWTSHLGRGDRLNGPIDNPTSSCMSCHSTAQIHPLFNRADGDSFEDFAGAPDRPYGSCTEEQILLLWYRDLGNELPFGTIDDQSCTKEPTSKNYVALDYSLQLKVGLTSSKYYANQNPCAGFVNTLAAPLSIDPDAVADRIRNSRVWSNDISFPNNRLIVDTNLDLNFDDQQVLER